MKKISIIVCTKDRPHKLEKCLDSIIESALFFYKNKNYFEIIIFDQSKHKKIFGNVGIDQINLKHIHSDTVGISIARNSAIMIAKNDIIAFTDDDCIVSKKWIEQIHKKFSENPEIKIIFGMTKAYQLSDYELVTYNIIKHKYGFDWQGYTKDGKRCFAIILKQNEQIFTKTCLPYANFGSSNNMACCCEIFKEYGLFSELFGAGSRGISAEDTEFQYRLLLSNVPIHYSPDIKIMHNNWLDYKSAQSQLDRYTCGTSAVFLYYGLRGDINALKYFWHIAKNNVLLSYQEIKKNRLIEINYRKYAITRFKYFIKGCFNGILFRFYSKLYDYL